MEAREALKKSGHRPDVDEEGKLTVVNDDFKSSWVAEGVTKKGRRHGELVMSHLRSPQTI